MADGMRAWLCVLIGVSSVCGLHLPEVSVSHAISHGEGSSQPCQEIPKIVHQMYLGSPSAETQAIMQHTAKMAADSGYTYMYWDANVFNNATFPITWNLFKELRHNALKKGGVQVPTVSEGASSEAFLKDIPKRFMSSFADMARFEILYTRGGIWLDANMEIVKPLNGLMDIRLPDGTCPSLVTCHETNSFWGEWNNKRQAPSQPNERVMSVGFVAAAPLHPVLARSVSEPAQASVLAALDELPGKANIVTGPYFFGSQIESNDNMLVLETSNFYPYNPWDQNRAKHSCCRCSKRSCATQKVCSSETRCGECNGEASFSQSFAVDHFECGGSWLPEDTPLLVSMDTGSNSLPARLGDFGPAGEHL